MMRWRRGVAALTAVAASGLMSLAGAGLAEAQPFRGCMAIVGRWSDGVTVSVRDESANGMYRYLKVSPQDWERAGGMMGACSYELL